jgi:Family of unknown function (DUF6152)
MQAGKQLCFWLAAAVACGVTGAARSHHSNAMFDETKVVTLEGTVRDFQWTNPHTWIQLRVMENGQEVEYSVEGRSPNALARIGWKRNTLKPGETVKVTMNPLKSGERSGNVITIVKADGTVISAREGQAR